MFLFEADIKKGREDLAALLSITSVLRQLWEARSGVDAKPVINPYPVGIKEINLDRNDLSRVPDQVTDALRRELATERLRAASAKESAPRITVADAGIQPVEHEVDQAVQCAARVVAHENYVLHPLP